MARRPVEKVAWRLATGAATCEEGEGRSAAAAATAEEAAV
jgi:hypothetical protein